MKTTFFYLVFFFLLNNFCKANERYSEDKIVEIKGSFSASPVGIDQNDTLLTNIQKKVMDTFVNDKISRSDKGLRNIEQKLKNLNRTGDNGIIIYWYSYACYYHSILLMAEKDNKNSERILNEGIAQLKRLVNPNSEHLALLALMESMSFQFASVIEIPFLSKRVKQNAERALQLDSLNLRAYFVLGSNDYYSPEQYGGGKKAIGYFLKAIKLNDQSMVNPFLPSWGKSSSYELLIRSLIKHKQFDDAKKYFHEASKMYPDDYMIGKLAKELISN
jgi:pentatricopeptide repeat protein